MASSQTRAMQKYRSRLGDRGLARFEVLGRDSDRSLIRSLARRLAEDGPEAANLRAFVSETLAGEPPKKEGLSRHSADHHWLEQISTHPVHAKKVARSICNALFARHQHSQQYHETRAFSVIVDMDG